MAVLDAIATAYLDRERARLGLPSREELAMRRAEEQRATALQASQLESAGLGREKMRAEIAALPETQRLQRESIKALTAARNAQATRETPERPLTGDAYLMSLSPEQQAALLKFKGQLAGAERAPRDGGGISPAVESNIINRLTTQWDKANTTVNELKRQRDLMQTGLAAARKGDMAAGSQAVLVTFQKILDPTSVVRESEYARSAAGQALLARIQGAAERLASGGAGVPVAELEAFANLADQFVQQATSNQALQTVRGRIAATADRYRIPHDVIFGVEPAPAAFAHPGGPQQASVAETWIEVAPGIRKKVKK